MAKKSGLGRGMLELFDDNLTETAPQGDVTRLRLSQIEPKADQPRKNFEAESLSALADSIAENGVLQPILVRPSSIEGMYQIIAGERRWRASKQAGMTDIPVIIVEADEWKAARFALIENLQREDLDPYEEAAAYNRLIHHFDLSQEEVGQAIGKSRSAVANSLRLLDLPEEITDLLRDGSLSAGHARALLGLKNPADMAPLAARIVAREMSVRETESAVKAANRAYLARDIEDTEEGPLQVDYVADLASRATAIIGRRLTIKNAGRKKTLTVEYQNDEDLEEILTTLCGKELFEGP